MKTPHPPPQPAFTGRTESLAKAVVQNKHAIGVTGATANVLAYALEEFRALGDRVIPEIRLASATTTLARR
jgi:hypothetical protein